MAGNGNGKILGLIERIMDGSELLPDEHIADEAITNAVILSKYANFIKEELYLIAEQKQRAVLTARIRRFENLYGHVIKASRAGNLDQYSTALQFLIEAGKITHQTALKMKRTKLLQLSIILICLSPFVLYFIFFFL